MPDLRKLIFSAKEAVYKCYYPLTLAWLDFHDVQIDLDLDTGTFVAQLTRPSAPDLLGSREIDGKFASTDRFVFTAVYVGPT